MAGKGWLILMRKYHRWVSAVAVIFLLFVSVTGVKRGLFW